VLSRRTALSLTLGLLLITSGTRAQGPPAAPARPAATAARAETPRLVVIIVSDQFRADYFEMYGHQWTHGLRRLYDRGAVFPLAMYPYASSVTCPGHSTIGTGTLPFLHGMTNNTFYDRVTARAVPCVTDPTATSVPFGGGTGTEHHSPRAVRVPAFADELRLQKARLPNIVSVALKPRSAIGLGGHGGPNTVVVWEEDAGVWATSDAYTKTPWPDVDAFVKSHPITAAYGQTWTKLLPESTYLFTDDGVGENAPGNWTKVFPHKIDSATGKPDNAFMTAWERSPFSDAYVADLAIHLLKSRHLGEQPGTDMLAVSFPALDLVAHEYGPRSHEAQDVMIRQDVAIGRLLDAIDRQVGAGRYVVAFAADHGVAPIPEQAAALGMDAGRIAVADIRQAVQSTAVRFLGEGTYFGAFNDVQLALTPGTVEQLTRRSGGIEAMKAALSQIPGISKVYGPEELASTVPTQDPILAACRLSYVAGRSGDFFVVQKPYWIARATGTTHGSPYGYDRQVPVILYGAGIRPGRYLAPASPVDIVPTLAALTRIELSQTSGRVLTEALVGTTGTTGTTSTEGTRR
jgi:predicted AlkP superfamily pyrophosphatase or phosphodiesterase